jgi:hypothetical protein
MNYPILELCSGKKRVLDIPRDEIPNLQLEFDDPLCGSRQMVIWDKEYSDWPVIEKINTIYGMREDVDFPRTGGVQFTPSLVMQSSVLLEGWIGISRPTWYIDVGVDHKKVQKLYHRIRTQVKRIAIPKVQFYMIATDGREVVFRGKMISEGGLEWYRSGKLLRQNFLGPVDYHVRVP